MGLFEDSEGRGREHGNANGGDFRAAREQFADAPMGGRNRSLARSSMSSDDRSRARLSLSRSQRRSLREIEESGADVVRRTLQADGTLKVSCRRGKCSFFELVGRGGGRTTELRNSADLCNPVVLASLIESLGGVGRNE